MTTVAGILNEAQVLQVQQRAESIVNAAQPGVIKKEQFVFFYTPSYNRRIIGNNMYKGIVLKNLLLSLCLLLLSACAANQTIIGDTRIWHSFTFNTYEFDGKGKQDVEVLDFLYGDPKGHPNKCYSELVDRGECQQGGNWNGLLYRQELKTLYVKWRIKSTGEVREVTLDMQKKLPANFGDDFELFFSFKGPQLYVYLVTPERRATGEPPNGPRASAYLKTLTLYPEE